MAINGTQSTKNNSLDNSPVKSKKDKKPAGPQKNLKGTVESKAAKFSQSKR
jgi:hypothetical protein